MWMCSNCVSSNCLFCAEFSASRRLNSVKLLASTERRGRLVGIRILYSEGLEFKSDPCSPRKVRIRLLI